MKIICIGRNYAAHADEMKVERPQEPVVFMKPPSALLVNNKPFYYPEFTQNLHFEVELVYRIAKNGRHVQPEFAPAYLGELGIGIDFTARDLQAKLKKKGQPWEIAKGFDGSAPISEFISLDEVPDQNAIEFGLRKNDELVQKGNSKDMLFQPPELVTYVSQYFRLHMKDLIFSGTPSGVGPVQVGDELEAFIVTKAGEQSLLHCAIR
ncbi:2-hydroxyhepta-2,4-diene-1,7-dioate isomerase [Lewinellaceae bacterium SD302]|nr:2-hydroxyhepta-2,4-diene-1,7-dioate isomerase [Lewinellaceae bacterium SD302]